MPGKEIDTMFVSLYISNILKHQERQKNWLAEKVNISKQTAGYKLKHNSFTAEELFDIADVLCINLEEMREERRKYENKIKG